MGIRFGPEGFARAALIPTYQGRAPGSQTSTNLPPDVRAAMAQLVE